MALEKVSDDTLRAYLEAGHSQADAARYFGVSEPAIHQRLKRMRHLTSRVVALERAHDVVEEKLSATARLERVQQVIDEELNWAVQEARREGGDRGALADVILKLAGSPPAARPAAVDLPHAVDLRSLGITRRWSRIRESRPDTARRNIARLKERRLAAQYRPAQPHRRSSWRCGVTRSTS